MRTEANGRPTVTAHAVADPKVGAETPGTTRNRDTSKAYLAGASSFSLAALAGTTEATTLQQGEDNE